MEIIARARLTLAKDSYLCDHEWRGSNLFPAVFGLEAMAQAVAYVTGENNLDMLRIENVQLERPIIVNTEKGTELEIRAVVMERQSKQSSKRIQVSISTEQADFSVEYFSATFVLLEEQDSIFEKIELPDNNLGLKAKEDLYNGKYLFQGPQFQRIKNIYVLDSRKCIFDSEIKPEFKSSNENKWLLGDPFFRDSLFHSAQLPALQHIGLPLSIGRVERFNVNSCKNCFLTGKVVITNISDDKVSCTITSVNENGQVIEIIDDYVIKIMEYHQDYPTPEELANPEGRDWKIIESEAKRCAAPFNCIMPQVVVANLPEDKQMSKEKRHRLELPVFREAVERCLGIKGKKDIRIAWLNSGKPVVEGIDFSGYDISLSHDLGTVLITAGQGIQGCDIQSITSRSREEWIVLLGKKQISLLDVLANSSDSIDQAGTRIWAAIEAGAKATGSRNIVLNVELQDKKRGLFRATATDNVEAVVLTFPVFLTRGAERIIAVTVKVAL